MKLSDVAVGGRSTTGGTARCLVILQLVSDVIFYDKKYNPGDPIPVDANFRPDVDEMSLPADYEEQGDEEDQPDES